MNHISVRTQVGVLRQDLRTGLRVSERAVDGTREGRCRRSRLRPGDTSRRTQTVVATSETPPRGDRLWVRLTGGTKHGKLGLKHWLVPASPRRPLG